MPPLTAGTTSWPNWDLWNIPMLQGELAWQWKCFKAPIRSNANNCSLQTSDSVAMLVALLVLVSWSNTTVKQVTKMKSKMHCQYVGGCTLFISRYNRSNNTATPSKSEKSMAAFFYAIMTPSNICSAWQVTNCTKALIRCHWWPVTTSVIWSCLLLVVFFDSLAKLKKQRTPPTRRRRVLRCAVADVC